MGPQGTKGRHPSGCLVSRPRRDTSKPSIANVGLHAPRFAPVATRRDLAIRRGQTYEVIESHTLSEKALIGSKPTIGVPAERIDSEKDPATWLLCLLPLNS